MTTYLVDWRRMVAEDFIEEFTRITRALCYARQTADATPEYEKIFHKGMPPEVRERYEKVRFSLRRCGYEVRYRDRRDLYRWRGWYLPFIDRRDQLQFHTTAPPDRVMILSEDFLRYVAICRRAASGEDASKELAANAERMASLHGVAAIRDEAARSASKPGPVAPVLDAIAGRIVNRYTGLLEDEVAL